MLASKDNFYFDGKEVCCEILELVFQSSLDLQSSLMQKQTEEATENNMKKEDVDQHGSKDWIITFLEGLVSDQIPNSSETQLTFYRKTTCFKCLC